jgi:4-alpha-glucanotransferase
VITYYSGLVYLVLSGWLEDAALFAAIDKSTDAFSWYEWPEPLKNRHLGALENIYQKQKDFVSNRNYSTCFVMPFSLTKIACIMQIEVFMAQQFLFQRQWQRIRTYAQKLGITIMGDMPIYVGYHSADVWANRKSFLLVCFNYLLQNNISLFLGKM